MKKVIVIIGPTASGKSGLAKKLLGEFPNLEAVSVDSRQIFQGLDLGSGKDKSFFQHLLDIAEPGEDFSAVKFRDLALATIEKIQRKNHTPLLVGGSPFYMDAILYERDFPHVEPNPILRQELEKMPTAGLWQRLAKLDVKRANEIDVHNRPRLMRAIEIAEATGQPVPKLGEKKYRYQTLILGIDIDRQSLYQKIDRRVDERIEQGMIKEVRDLIAKGVKKDWLKKLGLEYRLITEYLEAKYTKDEMMEKLKRETHAFSRRQLTWYRQNKDIQWVKNYPTAKKLIEEFI